MAQFGKRARKAEAASSEISFHANMLNAWVPVPQRRCSSGRDSSPPLTQQLRDGCSHKGFGWIGQAQNIFFHCIRIGAIMLAPGLHWVQGLCS